MVKSFHVLCVCTLYSHVFMAVVMDDGQQGSTVTQVFHQILHHWQVRENTTGHVVSTVTYLRIYRQTEIRIHAQTHTYSPYRALNIHPYF